MKKLIAAIFLTAVCRELYAENSGSYSFMTAEQLLKACASTEPFHYGSCLNYIAGTIDTFNMVMDMGAVIGDAYCLPSNITQTRVRFVTIEYITNHPAMRTYVAADQILQALHAAFPCNK